MNKKPYFRLITVLKKLLAKIKKFHIQSYSISNVMTHDFRDIERYKCHNEFSRRNNKRVNIPSFNPLSANPTKWSNKFKRFVGNLPTNCLSVFDHFMGLALRLAIVLKLQRPFLIVNWTYQNNFKFKFNTKFKFQDCSILLPHYCIDINTKVNKICFSKPSGFNKIPFWNALRKVLDGKVTNCRFT